MYDDDLISAWRELAPRARQRRDADAEDHLQDAVVAALDQQRRTGALPDTARAWLRTVARRREADAVRRAERERRVAAESAGCGGPDEYDATTEVLDRHEARWLAAHVDGLPPATRRVVRAIAAGDTQAEAAERLGLTPRAVEAHVRRARLALHRVRDRAGAVVVLLLGRRWWRRTAPVAAAGVAAAVGLSLVGSGEPHRLVPVPRPPHAIDVEPPAATPARAVAWSPPAARAAALVHGGRAAPRPVPRDTGTPTPSPDPVPRDDEEPPPDDPVRGTHIVLVDAKGGEVPTLFPTELGAWYDVTVAGTYSYNGRPTGLADCGHLRPEAAVRWAPYEALIVDGRPSPCSTMPADDRHVYQWRQRGTGSPMTFRVQDHGGGHDNVGALVVTITRVVGT